MKLKNISADYGIIAKWLHWLSALIIFGLILLGFYMGALEMGSLKMGLYWWHKSFGTLLFFLVIVRLGWRFANKQPAPIPTYKNWEKILAKIVQVLLYIGMIGMPVSGLLMSSAGDYARPFFGLFNMPDLVPGKNETLLDLMREVHEITAFCLLGAVILHGLGAFKHHFMDRDTTLTRMLPVFAAKAGAHSAALLFVIFICGTMILAFSEVLSESAEEKAAENQKIMAPLSGQ